MGPGVVAVVMVVAVMVVSDGADAEGGGGGDGGGDGDGGGGSGDGDDYRHCPSLSPSPSPSPSLTAKATATVTVIATATSTESYSHSHSHRRRRWQWRRWLQPLLWGEIPSSASPCPSPPSTRFQKCAPCGSPACWFGLCGRGRGQIGVESTKWLGHLRHFSRAKSLPQSQTSTSSSPAAGTRLNHKGLDIPEEWAKQA